MGITWKEFLQVLLGSLLGELQSRKFRATIGAVVILWLLYSSGQVAPDQAIEYGTRVIIFYVIGIAGEDAAKHIGELIPWLKNGQNQ